MAKCIICVGLIDTDETLLAWNHNKDSEYRMSMTFIQRVIFIHNEFEEVFGGDRSKLIHLFGSNVVWK